MAMMNIDGEGIGEAREYFRKQLVQMGVTKPNEEEAKAMQDAAANQQPDAQQAFLMAEAGKAQALTDKAQADTQKALADAKKTKAETAEILAGMDLGERQFAVDAAEKLSRALQPGPSAG
jgi:hypothetical protein